MTEILSPCGGIDSLTAALRCGADAVYGGVAAFNARRGAKNFTWDELDRAVTDCHLHGAKFFLTMNTLLTDAELPEAVETAVKAAECGIDGIIVQDLGLADALHRVLPSLPLHASTQLSIHSQAGLSLLKKLGFVRVVAAREMSKAGLEKLCKKAKELDMEVEVFVHGALCMCLSGQCLFSSMVGGRSGNRGLCAQPCRLPFAVENGTGYDLSLKDLSLIGHLKELADMGVTSFKIEGRMKRPEYVAVATAACRSDLDGGQVDYELTRMLSAVFSRDGFTDGYYVNQIGREMFGRRHDADKKLTEAVLGRIHELYRVEHGRVPLTLTLTAKAGTPLTLTAFDGQNEVTVFGDIPETARSKPTDSVFIRDKLSRLGNTPYRLQDLTVTLDDGLAVLGSMLSPLREKALTELNEKRTKKADFTVGELPALIPSREQKKALPMARFRSIDQIPQDLSSLSGVILPISSSFSSRNLSRPIYGEIPRGILGNDEEILAAIQKAKPYLAGLYCETVGGLELALTADLPILTGPFCNTTNNRSADVLHRLGADTVTGSVELSCGGLSALAGKTAYFAYGRVPLMLTRNCPNRNGNGCQSCSGISRGTDRLGHEFPLACQNGFTEIFNTMPTDLADRQDEFSADVALLYFTVETAEQAQEVLYRYQNKTAPTGDYTRGLYYRTVQ